MKLRITILFAFIAISTCVFSQSTAGDSTFSSPVIHTVKLYFSQSNWWDSLVAYKPLDTMMLASVEIDGVYLDSVGAQFKGNSSYTGPGVKKPFKIDFNEYVSGQRYDGLKTINLNNGFGDPTLMREKLFLDFCRAAGIPAPRCTYANLYLNDSLWGLYTMVEQVNKTFLEDVFTNDAGNLFKGDAQGTLQWYGSAQSSYYGKYELKTNETQNDWTDLVHLIDKINNTPSANFYDSVDATMNTTAWIKGWAANNIFVNLDSYLGSGHNYYIYHNTATSLFDYIVWDANEAFGKFNMGMTLSQLETMSMFYTSNPPSSRPLQDKMMQNAFYRSEYISTICEMVTNYFSHGYFDSKIDSLYPLIKPSVYADPHKQFTNQNFEDNINMAVLGNIPGLKSFITNRRNSLVAQLAANSCVVGINEIENSTPDISYYPNPASDFIVLESSPLNKIIVYSVEGSVIKSLVISHSQKVTVDLKELSAGVYFLDCVGEKGTQKIKVVKY